MAGLISIDIARWRRAAKKYLNAKPQILTTATMLTEECMDDGVATATQNITTHVYDAYNPRAYERTMTLLRSVRKRAGAGAAGSDVSGSIYVSRAALNQNPKGHGKPYDLFVEWGVNPPATGYLFGNPNVPIPADWTAAGHFPRLFWEATIQDMREKIIDEYGPAAEDRLVSYFSS